MRPHTNVVFLLEVIIKFRKELAYFFVIADLYELYAKLDARVRSTTDQPTQSIYLGRGCTQFI